MTIDEAIEKIENVPNQIQIEGNALVIADWLEAMSICVEEIKELRAEKERVIAELEKEYAKYDNDNFENAGYLSGLVTALNIVKGGGENEID